MPANPSGPSIVTSHSFPKSLATLIDEQGLSARIGADHLGHARVSETMNTCMARGRVHTQVADLLDRRITTNKRRRGVVRWPEHRL